MTLAVILGLMIGIALGSLGAGGSILAVPTLAYLAGQSASAATATSLVAVGAAAAVGAVGHARGGRVRWGAAAAFVVTGVAGSWAGAALNTRLDGDVLLLAFSALVLLAAQRMFFSSPAGEEIDEGRPRTSSVSTRETTTGAAGDRPVLVPEGATSTTVAAPPAGAAPAGRPRPQVGRLLVAGSVVGLLTGLFGVGGGFVIVPALALVLGVTMPVAIGTSLVVIAGNAAVALGFRGVDAVEWRLAVPFTITMLLGSVAGALIAHRLPARRSRRAFAVLLVLVALGNAGAAAVALLA